MDQATESPAAAAESFEAYQAIREASSQAPAPAPAAAEPPAAEPPKTAVEPSSVPAEGETAPTSEVAKPNDQEKGPKRDRSAQGRVKELLAQGRIEEAERILLAAATKTASEKAERELLESRTRKPEEPAKPAEAKPAAAADSNPKPVSTDPKFATYEDFLEALTDWKADQKWQESSKAQKANEEKTAAERAATERQRKFADAMTDARAEFDDFDAVTVPDPAAGTTGVVLNNEVWMALLDTEGGLKLAYQLGKDPAEAARVAKLSAAGQMMALGEIRAKLTIPSTPPEKPKPVSKAPRPIANFGAPEPAAPKKLSEASSFEEHEKLRTATA